MANLNINQIEFSWKGKTLQQITSIIQKNKNSNSAVNLFMKPPPLKIYRREIASTPTTSCNETSCVSIDEINRPGGAILASNQNGLVNITENKSIKPNNKTEIPGAKAQCLPKTDGATIQIASNYDISVQMNARKLVRSSGMIRKNVNGASNYCTDTRQYLAKRNRNYENQKYHFLRSGSSSALPGTNQANGNVYSANGPNNCPPFVLTVATSFQYRVNNVSTITVQLLPGTYSVVDVNSNLSKSLVANSLNAKLLTISYNTSTKLIVIQSNSGNAQILVNNSTISSMLGFPIGAYPPISSGPNSSSSTLPASISPNYNFVPSYYKPNNSKFAQQGSVTSSALINRKKYDTITKNGFIYQTVYGSAVGNALAYGVSDTGYTIKDKIGFPMKKSQVFSKYTDKIECVMGGQDQCANPHTIIP